MTLQSHKKHPTTRSNTTAGREPLPRDRSGVASWLGRGAVALLAASAGLAGWVVGEELLPADGPAQTVTASPADASADTVTSEASGVLSDDPIARLKARNASERVARLRQQLAQDRSAQGLNRGHLERATDASDVAHDSAEPSTAAAPPEGEDIRSGVIPADAAPVEAPSAEAVSVEEAGRVLDQIAATELASLPPTPSDEGVSVEEAAALLDRLGDEPESALPPVPDVPADAVPANTQSLPPAQGVLDQLANAENEPGTDAGEAVPLPDNQPTPAGVSADGAPAEESLPKSNSNSTPGRNAGLEPQPVSALRFVDDPDPEVEPVRDPHQLKKLGSILPFSDYEPDGEINASDRCQNLCPRPGDATCPDCKPGMSDDPSQLSCPECPEEVALNQTEESKILRDRAFPAMDYRWEAPNLWHYPLYFEDVQLERYGHSRPWYLQPFISTARMSGQILMGPYQLALLPPWRKDYTLGNYRPGQCVPYRYEQLPWNNRAAATQAGAMVGGYFLFAPTP